MPVENSFNIGTAIAGGIFFMAWIADVPPIASGEVSVRTVECLKNTSFSIDDYVLYSDTFRAEKSNNSVTYWHDDDLPDSRLNCAIRDKKNWRCEDGFSMVDGAFSAASWTPRSSGVWAGKFWGIRAGQWISKLIENIQK